MSLYGKYPAIVRGIDSAKRLYRVEIPSITDGAELLPLADVEYAIGDKSEHTEVRVLVGDRVWVEFIGGDPRYPLITGYRAKNTGNEVGTRRWHHDNFQTDADGNYVVNAGTRITLNVGGTLINIANGVVTIDASQTNITGNVAIEGNLNVAQVTTTGGLSSTGTAGGASIVGGMTVSGSLTNNGVNVGSGHTHPSGCCSASTGSPQ